VIAPSTAAPFPEPQLGAAGTAAHRTNCQAFCWNHRRPEQAQIPPYTDTLPERSPPHRDACNTSYQFKAVTATGAFSSSSPIAEHTHSQRGKGRRIRQAFCRPRKGYSCCAKQGGTAPIVFITRIMAHLLKDKGLLTAFSQRRARHNIATKLMPSDRKFASCGEH